MRATLLLAALVLALAVPACGSRLLKTKGRVLKDGAPLTCPQGEAVRVTFVPVVPAGQRVEDLYLAQYSPQDGTFWVTGKDLRGMPPGKYRVAIQYERKRRDVFKGKFDAEHTPFVFDVDAGTKELVIDLDKPPTAGG